MKRELWTTEQQPSSLSPQHRYYSSAAGSVVAVISGLQPLCSKYLCIVAVDVLTPASVRSLRSASKFFKSAFYNSPAKTAGILVVCALFITTLFHSSQLSINVFQQHSANCNGVFLLTVFVEGDGDNWTNAKLAIFHIFLHVLNLICRNLLNRIFEQHVMSVNIKTEKESRV